MAFLTDSNTSDRTREERPKTQNKDSGEDDSKDSSPRRPSELQRVNAPRINAKILKPLNILLLSTLSPLHTIEVRRLQSLKWVIVQTTPSSRALCLKDILHKKFPQHSFSYFDTKSKRQELRSAHGIVFELKNLNPKTLRRADTLLQQLGRIPRILIVTPEGYQILTKRHPLWIDHSLIILSETASLDYLLHIPRLIQEVINKRDLKRQNEELRKMINDKVQEIFKSGTDGVLDELMDDTHPPPCRIKVTMRRWQATSRRLGSAMAQSTLFETLHQTIAQSVRQGDRILHAKENEFLIFLDKTSKPQLERCRKRIEAALAQVSLWANDKPIPCPFEVVTIADH